MSRQVRVCFFIPRSKIGGGAERSIIDIMLQLNSSKEFRVFAIIIEDREGPLIEILKRNNIEYGVIGKKGLNFIDFKWENENKNKNTRIFNESLIVQSLLKTWKIDIIYSNTAIYNIGAIAAFFYQKPHIWHVREDIEDNVDLKINNPETVKEFIANNSSHIFFISEYLREKYSEYLEKDSTSVIYNKVNISRKETAKGVSSKVDIIIPFYKDDSILDCLKSVDKYRSKNLNKIYVIDDRGPDLELAQQVEKLCHKYKNFNFIQNEENKGFVYTCNKGMKLSKNDVLLLNSDTIVTSGWIDKMQANIYAESDIATTTVLSNSAGFYSVPDQFEKVFDNDPDQTAKFVEMIDPYSYIDTHTSHGFCMYIKRSVLNKLGYFNYELFGKGYGEETDFSMRVLKHNMRNIVSTNVYTHHWEGRSFGLEQKKKLVKGEKRKQILSLYPEINDLEKDFHNRDELKPIKEAFKFYHDLPSDFYDSDSKKIIVQIGEINSNKNQFNTLKAFKEAYKKNKDIRLILIGDYDVNDNYYKEMLKFINEYNLKENVFLTGHMDNPQGILYYASCCVQPSISEGLGRVAIESMALETPLITSGVGGLSDFCVHRKNCLVVEPNKPNQIANAILKVINDQPSSEKITREGLKTYEETFKNIDLLEKIKKVLLSNLETPKSSSINALASPVFYKRLINKNVTTYVISKFKFTIINSRAYRVYKKVRTNLAIKGRIYKLLGLKNPYD